MAEKVNVGSTLRTMRHSWVASRSCWRLPIKGSIAKCSRISTEHELADEQNEVWNDFLGAYR